MAKDKQHKQMFAEDILNRNTDPKLHQEMLDKILKGEDIPALLGASRPLQMGTLKEFIDGQVEARCKAKQEILKSDNAAARAVKDNARTPVADRIRAPFKYEPHVSKKGK